MSSATDNRPDSAPAGRHDPRDMARLVRDFAWAGTCLGPMPEWPASLQSLARLVLSIRFPAAVFWGPEMIQIYNDDFARLLGTKHPEALGRPARDVWAEAWPLVGSQLDKALKGESIFQENVLIPLLQQGKLQDFFFAYSYSPIFAADGAVDGVLVICHDTTQEQHLMAKLRKNEDKFRTFVEAVSDVVYRVSADWGAALQVEGRGFLPDTHTEDREWFKRNVHPDDQVRVRAAIEKAVREESVFELEHKVQRLDGTMGWTFSRAIPVRDDTGKVVEWFGGASDITVRKQAEQALLSAEKLAVVGRLASSIAHEINNPLEAVTNLLYLAVQKADPEIKELLLTAQDELQRVSQITANTLRFNRQKSLPAPIDVVEIMQSVLDLFRGRFRQIGVTVHFEKEKCPQFFALGGEIRQVFVNLIGNALDALQRGGILKIRVRPVTDWRSGKPGVRVTICDSGHGMGAKTQSEIFKPFFTTKENTGTGLGLWISAEVVQRHQGSIRVRSSNADGKCGTTFSLFFPQDGLSA